MRHARIAIIPGAGKLVGQRDLADPEVSAEFAQRVQTPRRLTALYLLTVADIRGTSARVWNAWEGKLLDDLYRATLAFDFPPRAAYFRKELEQFLGDRGCSEL